MISLEDIIAAAMPASQEQREAALRILRGELPRSEPLITLRALALGTGFGTTTLRRWNVPGHAIGGAKRYRISEVQDYLGSEEFQRRVAAIRAERRAERSPAQLTSPLALSATAAPTRPVCRTNMVGKLETNSHELNTA